jgi:hypothetical protein
MPERKVLPGILLILPATVLLTAQSGFGGSTSGECRAGPGESAPAGLHWYYRVDRTAFWAVVYKFRSPEWSPAFSDQPTFGVKGKHLTIRQVCELVKDVTDELPYLVAGELVKALRGDHRLIQLFAPSRTYAIGSQCLLELLEEHIARQREVELAAEEESRQP